MAVFGRQVSVSTSATLICAGLGTVDGSSTVNLLNTAATPIYIGNSNAVTTGAAFILPQNIGTSIPLREGDSLYGIVTTGTVTCFILQSY